MKYWKYGEDDSLVPALCPTLLQILISRYILQLSEYLFYDLLIRICEQVKYWKYGEDDSLDPVLYPTLLQILICRYILQLFEYLFYDILIILKPRITFQRQIGFYKT